MNETTEQLNESEGAGKGICVLTKRDIDFQQRNEITTDEKRVRQRSGTLLLSSTDNGCCTHSGVVTFPRRRAVDQHGKP